MAEWVPGSPQIIGDTTTINNASADYEELAGIMQSEKIQLKMKDRNLHNAFIGAAGDAFYNAYYTLEACMANLIDRHTSTSNVLAATGSIFADADAELEKDITIDEAGGSGH